VLDEREQTRKYIMRHYILSKQMTEEVRYEGIYDERVHDDSR
jgi:hypothetical protein